MKKTQNEEAARQVAEPAASPGQKARTEGGGGVGSESKALEKKERGKGKKKP